VPRSKAKATMPDNRHNGSLHLDDTDLVIVNTLLQRPDTSSSDLAKKTGKPLSTIQRRRAKLERTIIKKDYSLNTDIAGWRSGEFFLSVGNGRTEAVARQIFDKYSNITMVTTTVNSVGNMVAHIYFKDSAEMFGILEEIKRLPNVQDATYAEHIQMIGERKPTFVFDELRK